METLQSGSKSILMLEEQHFDANGTLRSRKVFTSIGGETIAQYYDVQGNPIEGPAA